MKLQTIAMKTRGVVQVDNQLKKKRHKGPGE
jgi:hypothetical protein